MKKAFRLALCAAVVAIVAACSSPASDGEKMANLVKDYSEAAKSGDEAKIEETKKAAVDFAKELNGKYDEKDTASLNEFSNALKENLTAEEGVALLGIMLEAQAEAETSEKK